LDLMDAFGSKRLKEFLAGVKSRPV
jgi:hypothetical protein